MESSSNSELKNFASIIIAIDLDKDEISLIENIQRENLKATES